MNKIIAIDGPTASGKGTLAKKISQHFNLPYLNTGGLYRAVALKIIKDNNADFKDKSEVIKILGLVDFSNLDNPELYLEDVGTVASRVSVIQEVRDFLFKYQYDFAHQDGGAVLDGRDIGTVICPDASFKFFIEASVEERAKRRYEEMINKGSKVDYNEILTKLINRDKSDRERVNSPLKKADGAIEVDTTNMSIDEVFKYTLSFIKF